MACVCIFTQRIFPEVWVTVVCRYQIFLLKEIKKGQKPQILQHFRDKKYMTECLNAGHGTRREKNNSLINVEFERTSCQENRPVTIGNRTNKPLDFEPPSSGNNWSDVKWERKIKIYKELNIILENRRGITYNLQTFAERNFKNNRCVLCVLAYWTQEVLELNWTQNNVNRWQTNSERGHAIYEQLQYVDILEEKVKRNTHQ